MTVVAKRTVNVYERKPLDFYPTPLWVVERLIERAGFDKGCTIWEPAAGNGAISEPLMRRGFQVYASDINPQGERIYKMDFVKDILVEPYNFHALVTNPPYGEAAVQFIKRGLALIDFGQIDRMLLLLPAEFDFAKGRTKLFGENRYFCRKAVLTARIKWFPEGAMTPTKHHAWFEWRRQSDNLKTMEWW